MIFGLLFPKRKREKDLGKPVGEIIHYFAKVQVGAIKVKRNSIAVNDRIYIIGHTTGFEQKITSMEIDKRRIEKALKGKEIGVKLKKRARVGDRVYHL